MRRPLLRRPSVLAATLCLAAVPASLGRSPAAEPTPTPAPAPPPAETLAPHRPPLAPVTTPVTQDSSGTSGSSLGEIVRKTREGGDVKKKRSLGTITNESLKKDGGRPSEAPGGRKGSGSLNVLPPGSMPSPAGGAAGPGPQQARDAKGRTEEEWRRILAKNREQQDKAESEIKRLELETKRLENDFYAWSDGNYRDRVIRPNWDQAREDLKKARTSLDAAIAARAELEEDARKSSVPPGWLRER